MGNSLSDPVLNVYSSIRYQFNGKKENRNKRMADIGCSLKDLPGVNDDRDGGEKESRRFVLSARIDDILFIQQPFY